MRHLTAGAADPALDLGPGECEHCLPLPAGPAGVSAPATT
jgi:hypothetical protein